jgi:hypothetical protein
MLIAGVEVADIARGHDPLGPRNHELPRKLSGQVLRSLGVDLTRRTSARRARSTAGPTRTRRSTRSTC